MILVLITFLLIINNAFSSILLQKICQQGYALKTNKNENEGVSEWAYFATKIKITYLQIYNCNIYTQVYKNYKC